MFRTTLKLMIAATGLFGSAMVVDSYVASSTNYIMEVDSINFAGALSTSTNYSLNDTLGEVGTGLSSSTNYRLDAGYQAMQSDIYIYITAPDNATMTPAISGITGGEANGSADWTVTTNSSNGYQLYVRAAAAPAMADGAGNSFADYVPSYANPDLAWNNPASQSHFGFSPEGDDTVAEYLDDGSSCGSGSGNTENACWNGFTTLNELIASSASANLPSGTISTIKFRAESGSTRRQPQGHYSADIILTAVAN